MFYHNTIRKYTLALLNFFKNLEVQYKNDDGSIITHQIPIHYKMREKEMLLDKTQTQILTGNTNVLPRAVLELTSLSASTDRQASKYNKINMIRTDDGVEYQYHAVSYTFSYSLKILCRGMNEACQIVEEIAPKFNPNIAIDLYDAENEDEPTRIPLQLNSIGIDTEGFGEKTMNICTVSCDLTLYGFLFQPIQKYSIIKKLKISLNTPYLERELMEWDVVNKRPVDPPKITYFTEISNFYLKPLSLEFANGIVTVAFETNSNEKPKIEFCSETCRIKQLGNSNMCEVSGYEHEFDISCSLELNGYRCSIYREFNQDDLQTH